MNEPELPHCPLCGNLPHWSQRGDGGGAIECPCGLSLTFGAFESVAFARYELTRRWSLLVNRDLTRLAGQDGERPPCPDYVPDGWKNTIGIPPYRGCSGDGHWTCRNCARLDPTSPMLANKEKDGNAAEKKN